MTPAETAIREALAEKERAVLVGKVALADLLDELDGERNRSQMYADLVRGVAVVLHGEGWSDTSKLPEEVAALRAELDRLRAERKPLTDEQIESLVPWRGDPKDPHFDRVEFARAVERAHGIGGAAIDAAKGGGNG